MSARPTFKVGDLVRVGKGKTTWRIETFWTSSTGQQLANLAALTGYASTSVALDRLRFAPAVKP